MVQFMSTKTSISIGSTASAINKLRISRIFVIFIIVFGLLLYVIDLATLNLSQFKLMNANEDDEPWSWSFVNSLDDRYSAEHKSYFVDEMGCRMPSFNQTDSNVDKFLADEDPVECERPLLKSNEQFIWIDMNETEIEIFYKVSDVDRLHCTVQPLRRKDDFLNEILKPVQTFRFGDMVKVNEEFIRVVCRDKKRKEFYKDYFFFRQDEGTNCNDKEERRSNRPDKMNVIIFGIDSVSRLNFRRRMNETLGVLLNELNAFELFGYNKVADNTYPNLIPALTGLDENELIDACMPDKSDTFDQCHFIWDEYKDNNYTTTYMEDMASLGLFQYLKNGFKNQPTDYNLRPLMVEMERYIAKQKSGNAHLCMGGRRTVDVLLENARKTSATFLTSRDPQFALFWTTSYTHDFLNTPMLIDVDIALFLRELASSGILKNTFLFVMSDHGIRWGSFRNTYQGMNEERQPFLYLVPPRSFFDNYPSAVRNLALNRHRLTTHFDLYETLRDLVDLKSLTPSSLHRRSIELVETEPLARGISLFLPVPTSRTCYDACIEPHWCTCHEKEVLPTTDARVERVARMIVDTMNKKIAKYPECHKLYLNSISDANIGTSNNITKDAENNFVDVTVRLQTKPGMGEFEATVRVHQSDELQLTGSISRTNLYGKQSQCIKDYNLKLYCFCDILL